MSKQQEHPAELLHRARDLVQDATTHLEQFTEPSPDDLYGLGSAIVTGLSALWQLSDVLTKQVMDYDEQQIAERAVADHPVEDLRASAEHLMHLRGILSVAYADAQQYWTAIRRVYQHTEAPDSTDRGDTPTEEP